MRGSADAMTEAVGEEAETPVPGKLALTRHIVLAMVVSSLLFLGLAAYGDFRQVMAGLIDFPARAWLTALGLALVNYFLRSLRWHYYLRRLGLKPTPAFSLMTFMAGLAMAVSPGKVGELVKSYLLKRAAGVPFSHSLPLLLAERGTDALAMVVLAVAFGAVRWSGSLGFVAVLMLALMFVFLLVKGERVWYRLIDAIRYLPHGERIASAVAGGYVSLREVLGGWALVVGTTVALAAWFAECYALFVVARAAGAADVGVPQATVYYALATLAGAATMAPGGLGATEAALSAMMVASGIAPHVAVTTTLVVRVCTLWFAVPVGITFLLLAGWLLARRDMR